MQKGRLTTALDSRSRFRRVMNRQRSYNCAGISIRLETLTATNGRLLNLGRKLLRLSLGAAFICAGALHFVFTDFMTRMIPPAFPEPRALVFISGLAEIILGCFVFVPSYRRTARWGLIALLVSVFPANLWMALHPEQFPEIYPSLAWIRLPFQLLFIGWVLAATKD